MRKITNYLEYILVMITITIIRILGIDNASYIIGNLARIIGPLHKSSLVAQKNLKLAFPKWSKQKINDTVKDVWENLGRTAAELPFISKLPNQEIKKRIKINNKYLLSQFHDKPVILVGGHFANWEMATRSFLTQKLNPVIIYRKANNPLINDLILSLRANQKIDHIPKGQESAIKILKALKQNRSVALLIDQKLNTGTKANFLGKEAMTTNMPAKLALKLNIPIIYGRIKRNNGAYFTLSLTQITLPTNKNTEQSTQKITQDLNNLIEKDAKTHPGQWFWVHKRFDKKFYK